MTSTDTPLLPAPGAPLLLTNDSARGWRRHPKWLITGVLLLLVLLALALGGWLHHHRDSAASETNRRARDALPMISVVAVKRSTTISELLLPGSVSAITEASLYARASGYLKQRYVDIGDFVRKGQVLALIESPDLDQQVLQGAAGTAQARQQAGQVQAAIGDARAKLDLASATLKRYETLLTQDAATPLDVDQRRQEFRSAQASLTAAEANLGAARAAVRAADANQRRLVALQQFEQVRAPFDGVVTARNVDDGALINSGGASLGGGSSSLSIGSSAATAATATGQGAAGGSGDAGASSGGGSSSGGAANELFRIAQIDRLRVYIGVPQENALAVQIGSEAKVFLEGFTQPFQGRVTRTAHALDPSARTLLTEVQIGNDDHALMPGMYAQVRLSNTRAEPPLLVPGETLIARAGGVLVATVAPLDDAQRAHLPDAAAARCTRRIHLQPVVPGRDYGTQVEVLKGLHGGEFLVANPGDDTTENALALPRLQPDGNAPGAGSTQKLDGGSGSKADASSANGNGDDQGKGKDEGKDGKADPARVEAEQRCIDEQAAVPGRAAAASAAVAAPAGAAPSPGQGDASTNAPSEESPSANQAPSLAAPTQGGRKPANGAKPAAAQKADGKSKS